MSKEPFKYLESTKSFEGISTVNLHDTSQKQSTGKNFIFWGRKQNQIRNDLLISLQIARDNTIPKEILFPFRKYM